MIEKTSTLYKMIVLYMLERVDFPLSNTQITSFFLDNDYTTYFHVQQTINELLDSRLIQKKKQGNSTCYMMTETGKETLSYFGKNLSDQIRGEIEQYLKERKYDLKNEHALRADYYRPPEQEYLVRCQVMEKKTPLITLELTVPTEEIARTFCGNWSKKSPEIYAYLMSVLS